MPKNNTGNSAPEKKLVASKFPPLSSHSSTCVLAFDFGMRNIGVAVGRIESYSTQEIPSLKAKDGIPEWPEIELLIQNWLPQLLVVGLPLNMDGTESQFVPHCRKFSNRLREKFKLPVELFDERLSSFEAKKEANDRGHRFHHEHNPIDSIAARLILENWIDENRKKNP